MSTTVSISVNPIANDMVIVDLGDIDLSGGTFRLVSLELGPVRLLISGDRMDELDRLTAMVTEARVLLTHELSASVSRSAVGVSTASGGDLPLAGKPSDQPAESDLDRPSLRRAAHATAPKAPTGKETGATHHEYR